MKYVQYVQYVQHVQLAQHVRHVRYEPEIYYWYLVPTTTYTKYTQRQLDYNPFLLKQYLCGMTQCMQQAGKLSTK